jgi:hypothetical protein
METIELNQQELISLYNNANDSGKKLLENKYGKETFVKPNIMDRVKTAEQAFAIKGISIASIIQPNDAIDEVAYKVLKVIVEILNEGWVPDWKNNNQYKYYPWFDVSSGSGLSCLVCGARDSRSVVGSRLCFKSSELAKYAGKQFKKLYEQYFLLK